MEVIFGGNLKMFYVLDIVVNIPFRIFYIFLFPYILNDNLEI